MGRYLNLTLLRDRYYRNSMRLCGGRYCTAFSFFMLGSPTRNANGFYGILGGEVGALSPEAIPKEEVFNELGFEVLMP